MNTVTGQSLSMKGRIKHALQTRPAIWGIYWRFKQELKRILKLRYFWYDILHTYRYMFWPWGQRDSWGLGAELLFQYHKLEKGLVMPGKPRLFGLEPAIAVMDLVDRWERAGFSEYDPIYQGAIETLRCYHNRISHLQLDPKGLIAPRLDQFLQRYAEKLATEHHRTPFRPALPDGINEATLQQAFDALAQVRRSVRSFKPDPVDPSIIERAVQLAQLSPSACNRQPCGVIIVDDMEKRKQLLELQNGNKGFGHLAPHIGVITADERGFFDATERHEPYVDGGLFAMSFILALRSAGVGSCCLNWCVPPVLDRVAHELLGLHPARRIIMLVAIGRPLDDQLVPRSPRRETENILTRI